MTVQIELGGFCGAPVRRNLREFADNKPLDVRASGFFVIEIGADISDVRIRQADDLARIAGIGENFLIAGEAGIENDFPASARDGAGGAPVKYAPVFQSESGRPVLDFGQFVLRAWS
jgi:hypothetical protein